MSSYRSYEDTSAIQARQESRSFPAVKLVCLPSRNTGRPSDIPLRWRQLASCRQRRLQKKSLYLLRVILSTKQRTKCGNTPLKREALQHTALWVYSRFIWYTGDLRWLLTYLLFFFSFFFFILIYLPRRTRDDVLTMAGCPNLFPAST